MNAAHEMAAVLHLRPVSGRREWRGACPSCSYDTSLLLTECNGYPLWWCASCQDREGVTAAIQQVLGSGRLPLVTAKHRIAPLSSTASKPALALALWEAALPLPGTPAQRYLAMRASLLAVSAALRFYSQCPHPSGGRLPALLAAIHDVLTGELRAVHRTFLHSDGAGKAAAAPAKATLRPVAGGAVMLEEVRPDRPLVFGEGIESSLSAARIIGGTAWYAVAVGNLARLPLPSLPACPVIIIAADPDAPGQRNASTAARRWFAKGRRVQIAMPNAPDMDFNDMLCAAQAWGNNHA